MTYFHLLPKEEVKEALRLPNVIFQKKYSRPCGCEFFGALDREFGCPFLFKYKKAGVDIKIKCVSCTCWKNKPQKDVQDINAGRFQQEVRK